MSKIQSESKPIPLNSSIKATDRYKKYLQVLSLFSNFPLTDLEMQIIEEFYLADHGNITTASRRTVRENLSISAENLNNYIRAFRKRGLMNDTSIHPLFLTEIPQGNTMTIIITLDVTI